MADVQQKLGVPRRPVRQGGELKVSTMRSHVHVHARRSCMCMPMPLVHVLLAQRPSRRHHRGSPFGDPATVSVADTGAGLCVWVNRATGQLGNWATGQLVPSGDNGATGRRPASATSTQPSFLPTFRPSDLPTFLTFLPSFLPTVPSYLRRSVFVVEDRLLWFTINADGFISK